MTLLALALLAGCDREITPVDPGWDVVFTHEFDGAAGSAPDPSVWAYDLGGGGWGNDELQFYTDEPDNVRLTGDGTLEIVALEESRDGHAYTSARLKTEGLFELTYGKVEARLKFPAGQGLWPAFWMLGTDYSDVGWPACGEVDVFEARGQNPDWAFGTLHGPGYSGGAGVGGVYEGEDDLASEFHVYAVDIDPEHVSWYVDGELYHRAHPGHLPEGTAWVFDHDQFLLANLAVGGTFVGDPNETTTFPAVLEIDWVRVSERIIDVGAEEE